jgi:hypothetical protein
MRMGNATITPKSFEGKGIEFPEIKGLKQFMGKKML